MLKGDGSGIDELVAYAASCFYYCSKSIFVYFETNWVVGFVEALAAGLPGLFSFEALTWIDVVGKERVDGDWLFLKRVCAKLKG